MAAFPGVGVKASNKNPWPLNPEKRLQVGIQNSDNLSQTLLRNRGGYVFERQVRRDQCHPQLFRGQHHHHPLHAAELLQEFGMPAELNTLSLIHISEPTRRTP